MAIFSGAFGGTLYVKASDILALTTARAPNCSDNECECEERNCKKNRNIEMCCNPMSILRMLNTGAIVRVWFDSSNFRTTSFQCIEDNMAVFTGGEFDGGFTYIKACNIKAIQIGTGLLLTSNEDTEAAIQQNSGEIIEP
jgi:hypothetical protein